MTQSVMKPDFESIKVDLGRLRLTKKKPKVFGSEAHGFTLNPALSEEAVCGFEEKYGIQLPADYRQFLIEVGNGGAGPYYGLFKLGEMDDSFDYTTWEENDGFIGDLSEPFPHIERWNDLEGEPNLDDQDEEEYDRQLEEFDERYWCSSNLNGAIPICHLGCASRQWLVITGAEKGNVWCDERADMKGVFPLASETNARVTFYEWYRSWLDEAVRKLNARKSKR